MSIFDKAGQPQKPAIATQTTAVQNSGAYDSLYERMGQAKPAVGATYLQPGVYPVLYVDSVRMKEKQAGGVGYLVEFLILESENPNYPAGTRVSWMSNLKYESDFGNCRAFIAASMSCSLDEVDKEAMQLSCSADNPIHGRLIRAEAFLNKKGTFTHVKWFPISEEKQSLAEEARKAVFGE